jgi:uncharacterized protein DUF6580
MTYLIVVLAVLARFAPHPPNFTPAYGVLLFGGAYLKKRDSIWFPLVLLAASDLVLTTWVYGMRVSWSEPIDWLGFAAIALLGLWLRNRGSARNVLGAALAGPTLFFLISNFGVWLGFGMYPRSFAGLAACYIAALPFFGNSLAASVLYGGLLFCAYEAWRRRHARATDELQPANPR